MAGSPSQCGRPRWTVRVVAEDPLKGTSCESKGRPYVTATLFSLEEVNLSEIPLLAVF